MKKAFGTIAFLAGLLVLTSCGGNKEEKEVEKVVYTYNHENTTMEWTAFKYESKAPVKGTFTTININGVSGADNVKSLAESLSFTIPVSSIATHDESRDAKIIQFFFGTMTTETLTGHFTKLTDDGVAEMEVTMHGITDVVSGTYEINDNYFTFNATMDISKWNTDEAINVLNENCKANHTENGVTKVWSEVDLSFSTKFEVNKK
jgi:polyisoprenoid-binding protein YceI